MALADWVFQTGINGDILHGPTLEVPPVNSSAGDFAYAFNSSDAAGSGVVSLAFSGLDQEKGTRISGTLTKVSSEGEGCSVFLFSGLSTGLVDGSVSDQVYLLGIQNDGSNRLVLAKGRLDNGIPSGDPGTSNGDTKILAKGTASYETGSWAHVRLDTVVQTGGDVVLIPYINTAAIGATENWVQIPGMSERLVDGITQIFSGSPPLVSGRAGFGFHFNATGKSGAVDYIKGRRQV